MYRIVIDALDIDQWDKHCRKFAGMNIYQDGLYGHLSGSGIGRSCSRVALFKNEEIEAMAQLRIKKVPLTSCGVAEIDWGPLWHHDRELPDYEGLKALIDALRQEICDKRKLQLRVRPYSTFTQDVDSKVGNTFLERGFSKNEAVRPYHTVIIDLSDSLEKIRSKFHQKWRNQLNIAERSGLKYEFSSGVEHFERFFAIYKEMWKLKQFPTGVRLPTIRKLHAMLPEDTRFLVTLVRNEDTDIGGTVCSVRGETLLYFLGATLPGPWRESRPGYLLQWLHIQKGKELGLRWYDLGGYDDDEQELAGWKKRTNGSPIVFPGQYEASSTGANQHIIYSFAEKSFQSVRRKLVGR